MSFSPRILLFLLYAVINVRDPVLIDRALSLFRAFEAKQTWWAQVDSNHRPRAYQARALTS